MPELYSFPFLAMGTECNIHIYAETEAKAREISEAAIAEVYRIEARYSRYNPESFLSVINRAAHEGASVDVDEETAGIIDYAFACYESSEKLFDITSGILRKAWDFNSNKLPENGAIENLLPRVGMEKIEWKAPTLKFLATDMELDFGGIGKEYAADRAAEICQSHGVHSGLVDLGGDINVIGPHPNGDPWVIDIRDPRKPESSIGVVKLATGALASSGDYERCIEIDGKRYSHILNPFTGWPVHGLSSVSVIADKCVVAGSLCTIAMLKGKEGAQWLKEIEIMHYYVDEDGEEGGDMEIG